MRVYDFDHSLLKKVEVLNMEPMKENAMFEIRRVKGRLTMNNGNNATENTYSLFSGLVVY